MRTLLIILLLSAKAQAKPPEAPITGKVVGVTDGDTIDIREPGATKTTRIRLAEIDAPEKAQPWGSRSRDFTANRTLNKQATVKVDAIDRYGRVVGHVTVNGVDIGRELVNEGLAWQYKAYSKDKTLAALEAAAFRKKRGLWADAKPIAPWDWRKMSFEEREKVRNGK